MSINNQSPNLSRVSTCSTDTQGKNRNRLSFQRTESGNYMKIDANDMVCSTPIDKPIQVRNQTELVDNATSPPIATSQQTESGYDTTTCRHTRLCANDSFKINSQAARIVFDFLYRSWKEERLCDVILKTMGGDEILAHQLALSAFSDDLTAIFSGVDVNERGNIHYLNCTDINKATVQRVVRFVYTQELDLDDHNVIETLFCSSQLGIVMACEICMNYIRQRINPQNALLLYNYANQYYIDEVVKLTIAYIARNFKMIMSANDQKNIPVNLLLLILDSPNLVVDSELYVFEVIVVWVERDLPNRLTAAAQLLKRVRYQLISAEQAATKIQSVSWLFRDNASYNWLYEVIRYHALKSSGSEMVKNYTPPPLRGCPESATQ